MRAISIKQPWAWAILHCGKRIENRSREVPWSSAIGTTVLIHASAQVTLREYRDAANFIRAITGYMVPDRIDIPLGCIVGRCRIWGTRTLSQVKQQCSATDQQWAVGPYCLLLDQVVAIAITPCKGHQGLWTVPKELEP